MKNITRVARLGTVVPEIDLVGLFAGVEGEIDLYYGRIGHGKTYSATSDALDDVMQGNIVWVNWKIEWQGFDERSSFKHLFFKTVFNHKMFFNFPSTNLKQYEISDSWAVKQGFPAFIDWLEAQTDCIIYADEGHVLLDSYKGIGMDMKHRVAILHTRHKNRSIKIITQRPTAIHVSARANVNRFYKCEKRMSWPWLIFKRSEYQDLKSETVDESVEPISTKVYFARKEILNAYDTHYLRAGIPVSNKVEFEAYELSFLERLFALIGAVFPKLMVYVEKPIKTNVGGITPLLGGNTEVRPSGKPPLGEVLPKRGGGGSDRLDKELT